MDLKIVAALIFSPLMASAQETTWVDASRFIETIQETSCVMSMDEFVAYAELVEIQPEVLDGLVQTMMAAGGVEIDRDVPAIVVNEPLCSGSYPDYARAVAPDTTQITAAMSDGIKRLFGCQMPKSDADATATLTRFFAARFDIELPTDPLTAEALDYRAYEASVRMTRDGILIEGETPDHLTFEGCDD
jgi:hypothetical protein|tara:strand:- start:8575 stop:9141 length:567 start_codon:yes stop_codon:yes gene_type:complete